jgi:acetamidase/formamidase
LGDPKTASKGETMQRTHYLSDEHVHYKWDVENEPLVVIESGDTVVVETRDISDRQVGPESDASALDTFDWGRAYPLTGPIAVHDANPRDTLRIEILDVQTRGWGWTGVIPGFGLLTEEFSQGYVRAYDLSNGSFAYLREDIAVPLAPYFGTMGVCPEGAKDVSIIPPGRFGGNMDNRQLVRGSTLYLPSKPIRPCSPAVMPTPRRAMVRSAEPLSRRRCTLHCASRWKRVARSSRRSTARLRL